MRERERKRGGQTEVFLSLLIVLFIFPAPFFFRCVLTLNEEWVVSVGKMTDSSVCVMLGNARQALKICV